MEEFQDELNKIILKNLEKDFPGRVFSFEQEQGHKVLLCDGNRMPIRYSSADIQRIEKVFNLNFSGELYAMLKQAVTNALKELPS
jgi:hypothetical protein